MAQQHISAIALLIAVGFVLIAVTACANSEHTAPARAVTERASGENPGVPEFHDAAIGQDTLRSRISE